MSEMTDTILTLARSETLNECVAAREGPPSYRRFLATVGWGELRGFFFTKGFIAASDIFDPETSRQLPVDFQIFGDDMAGAVFGFRGTDEGVYMVDSVSPDEIGRVSDDFEAFLKQWFSE